MQDLSSYHYTPRRKRFTGIKIVIAALLAAALIPAAAILIRYYFYDKPADSAGGSSAESSAPPQEPEPSETELSSSEPEPEPPPEPVFGLVPESDPVEQTYFDDAVFFGDSITSGVSAYPAMSNATVIAKTGVNPDSVINKQLFTMESGEQVSLVEALKRAEPGKVYIQLGANWVGTNTLVTEETFLKYFRAMLDQIVSDNPDSVVYIQSIFPVSRDYETNANGHNQNGITNEIIQGYNRSLATVAEEKELYYLDVYSTLADEEGYLPDEATSDGMHLKPDYYDRWFTYLKTHTVTDEMRGLAQDGDSGESSSEEESSGEPLEEEESVNAQEESGSGDSDELPQQEN